MKRLQLLPLLTVLFCTPSQAALWFTDQPPDKAMLSELQNAHGGLVRMENNVFHKQLWLKKGDSLGKAAYTDPMNKTQVMDTEQAFSEPTKKNNSIQFAMPKEGFYNAYYTERSVGDNTLNINTAKAEALKHNCREGHNYDRKLVNPNQWAEAPLEIVRLRQADEDFHTRIQSGTLLKFKILHNNQPVKDASVRLETQKGWIKTTQSDADGIATFQVIQDSFPEPEADAKKDSKSEGKPETKPEQTTLADKKAEHGDKEHKSSEHGGGKGKRGGGGGEHGTHEMSNFLVTAEYTAPETGTLDGKPYQQVTYTTAMTGSYTFNTAVSQSKQWALLYASGGFLTLGVGATLYRRRIKPFKEVSFDER
jgi:hypothetical protein